MFISGSGRRRCRILRRRRSRLLILRRRRRCLVESSVIIALLVSMLRRRSRLLILRRSLTIPTLILRRSLLVSMLRRRSLTIPTLILRRRIPALILSQPDYAVMRGTALARLLPFPERERNPSVLVQIRLQFGDVFGIQTDRDHQTILPVLELCAPDIHVLVLGRIPALILRRIAALLILLLIHVVSILG